MSTSALLVLLLGLTGCASEFCSRHSDCAPGTECGSVGVCVLILPQSDADLTCLDCDASLEDGSVTDAAVADAALVDASLTDASMTDASLTDASPPADAFTGPLMDASGPGLPVVGKGTELVGKVDYYGL